jgi:hypothetical protein
MCSRLATQFHGGPITFKLQIFIQAPASHLVSPQSRNQNVRTMRLEVYRSQNVSISIINLFAKVMHDHDMMPGGGPRYPNMQTLRLWQLYYGNTITQWPVVGQT